MKLAKKKFSQARKDAMLIAECVIKAFESSGSLLHMVDRDAGADSCFDVLLNWGSNKERRLTVQVHDTSAKYVSPRTPKSPAPPDEVSHD